MIAGCGLTGVMTDDRWIEDCGLTTLLKIAQLRIWQPQSTLLNHQSSDRHSSIPNRQSAIGNHQSPIINDKSDVF
jgi:hypothetical protein